MDDEKPVSPQRARHLGRTCQFCGGPITYRTGATPKYCHVNCRVLSWQHKKRAEKRAAAAAGAGQAELPLSESA